MIEIKKILKKDIPELMSNTAFWNHSFLSISKHRLYSHYKNPNCGENDIVLLLSYLDNELVGYMGVFIDKINLDNTENKIGWLSTWWVHPKTKGTGIGREILNTMYIEMEGKIGISQFTPSAKRVYDKSGYFNDLKRNIGMKAVLRSNLSFVIPTLYPKLKSAKWLWNTLDNLANFFINIKLDIQKLSLKKKLKNIQLEYLNIIDSETEQIIEKYGNNALSKKTPAFFEWLKAYYWVQKAPLLEFTNSDSYEFSMYDKDFEIFYIKVMQNKTCIGFIALQKRNHVAKLLFSYFDDSKYSGVISDIIKLQCAEQNVREIICYEDSICDNFKKSGLFLYRTKKIKESIISKAFNKTDFSAIKMNFGDGDCSFA